MRRMRTRIHQAANIAKRVIAGAPVLVAILVAVAACGSAQPSQVANAATNTPASTATPAATATPVPTATPRPTPTPAPTATPAPFAGKIVRVVNSVPWLTGSVSVSCPAGSILVGGGVDNGYGTSDYINVESSYPSSANTWTVFGPASNVSYNLSAVADCLQTTTPFTTKIVKLTSPTSSYNTGGGPVEIYDARCPSGIVTGGGYDVNGGYVIDSHPDGANGWVSSSMRSGLTAYVICATARLSVKRVSAAWPYPKYSGSGPALVVQSTIACPSGYTPLSGGFGEPQSSNVQVGWGSSEFASSGQQWVVTGANKSGIAVETGYIYALCAQLA